MSPQKAPQLRAGRPGAKFSKSALQPKLYRDRQHRNRQGGACMSRGSHLKHKAGCRTTALCAAFLHRPLRQRSDTLRPHVRKAFLSSRCSITPHVCSVACGQAVQGSRGTRRVSKGSAVEAAHMHACPHILAGRRRQAQAGAVLLAACRAPLTGAHPAAAAPSPPPAVAPAQA